jgi:hypothetical protein
MMLKNYWVVYKMVVFMIISFSIIIRVLARKSRRLCFSGRGYPRLLSFVYTLQHKPSKISNAYP